MRRGLKWLGLGLLIAALLITGKIGYSIYRLGGLNSPWFQALLPDASDYPPTDENAIFYRLTAKYMHGDEPVDFDIVVGCGVVVAIDATQKESYRTGMYPRLFVKATKDGGAIMQLIPRACEWELNASRGIPADLLPGAVWFDKADNLTLGIAYVSEDAFKNSKSKLKFLGATMSPATRADWQAFQPTLEKSLISSLIYFTPKTWPFPNLTEADVREAHWDKAKLAKLFPELHCKGYSRLHISDPAAQAVLAKYRPPDKPRFWAVVDSDSENRVMRDLRKTAGNTLIDGHPLQDYRFPESNSGYPTHTGGGMLKAGPAGTELFRPMPLYPLRADEGLPWLTPAVETAPILYRDVDLMGGSNSGYLYCFTWYQNDLVGNVMMPGYLERNFVTRVDGEPIQVEDFGSKRSPQNPIPWFFEGTEFLYINASLDF